jgi:hypothetical protein
MPPNQTESIDTPLAEAEGILNSATDLKMFCQERQFLNLSTVGIPPIDEPNSETSQRIYLQKRTRIFPALFGYALPYLTIPSKKVCVCWIETYIFGFDCL